MKKAFTLIELLVVIAIIGILAGILFVSIGRKPLVSARDSKRTSDLQNLRTALTLYYTDNNQYPTSISPLVPSYIPGLPQDPRHGAAGCGLVTYPSNSNGVPSNTGLAGDFGYRYLLGTNSQSYVLQACLEDNTNPAITNDCDTTTADPPCFDATGNNVYIYDLHS